MSRPALALLLAWVAAPALAQHDHDAHAGHRQHADDAPRTQAAERTDHAAHAGHAAHATAPAVPVPPPTDADRAAAVPPGGIDLHAMHGAHAHHFVLFDRLEALRGDGDTGVGWDISAWYGGDLHRLWLRGEGVREDGATAAQTELLYGHPLTPWWDLLAGVRVDHGDGADRAWAALGVQGLAPYRFEVEATAWVDRHGHVEAGVEVERETLLSQRLILQSSLEARVALRDDPARQVEAGPVALEAGLRLRWEIDRRFAPYVGVSHERALGGSADRRRAAGDDVRHTRVVAGVRFWF
ncbi:copper resistance protein B [Arenimonas composti]|uniref:Copper resistance protein B n=1 Tax=Arenimonas composti TR7-09 = DSM 18010 TaxID=1121013 RepID=A0A091B3M1_9GAMM|nr:copper resistance protein B [Arenimonas composti]KFN46321.1 hypothetical protein P873_02095 [Arenimonas composti TR7-09 = DSM 18010]